MNKKLNENAITLIALTITIVVLIILAGVAINLSLGENGLFKKAKYGAEEYTNAQSQEETEVAEMTNEIDKIVNSNRDYEDEINNLKTEIQMLKNINSLSTEEKIIGTWIDGNPLYQKVVLFGETKSVGTSWTYFSNVNIANINIKEAILLNNYYGCLGMYLGASTLGLRNLFDAGSITVQSTDCIVLKYTKK